MAVEQPRTPEQREADLAAAEAHAAELEEEIGPPQHAVDHDAKPGDAEAKAAEEAKPSSTTTSTTKTSTTSGASKS